jgi:MscS family membrane protein
MEIVWNSLIKIDYSGMPIAKILTAIAILSLIQILRHFLVTTIINQIEQFITQRKIGLSEEWISILNPLLSSLVLVGGLWLVKEILADHIGDRLNEIITKVINLIVLFVIASAIYKAAPVLGKLVAKLVLHTGTNLDDLLRPLLPKIFQSIAIVGITIKFSEIFLGQSAAALVGLLGGAGITLGLIFKELVHDWFCTIIIYLDKVYQEGDWLKIANINSSVRVVSIGFRTTSLHAIEWGSIVKMPNSKMISGIVENWSQHPEKEPRMGISLTLRIDHVSAQQIDRICDRLQAIPKSIQGCYESCRVRFSKIESNARVIEVLAFVNDEKLYFTVERQLNLAILELLEHEGIDFLSVQLQVDTAGYNQSQPSSN